MLLSCPTDGIHILIREAVRKWLDANYTREVERKGETQKTRPSSSTDDLIASSRTLVNQDDQQKINVKLKID